MNRGQRQVVYWVLFLAFAVGAIAAGCTKSFDRGDFGYPHQGLPSRSASSPPCSPTSPTGIGATCRRSGVAASTVRRAHGDECSSGKCRMSWQAALLPDTG